MEELLTGLILAAETTAQQASGNDKQDWNNFAAALRKLRDHPPKPTPQR